MHRPRRVGILLVALVTFFACAQEPSRFVVVGFNARHSSLDEGALSWENRRPIAIGILQDTGAHLIGVQEAAEDQREELPQQLEMACVGCDEPFGNHNIVLFDDELFTVIDSGTFWLSDTPDVVDSTSWGNEVPRFVTWVRFRKDVGWGSRREFVLYNTHLDHEAGESRMKGLELIAQHAADHADTLPLVLMGDLNAFPVSPELEFLRSGDRDEFPHLPLRDVLAEESADESIDGTYHAFSGEPPFPRIDYILVSSGWTSHGASIITTMADDGTPPSDHFPVVAYLQLAE